jgi:hypothetical protein
MRNTFNRGSSCESEQRPVRALRCPKVYLAPVPADAAWFHAPFSQSESSNQVYLAGDREFPTIHQQLTRRARRKGTRTPLPIR